MAATVLAVTVSAGTAQAGAIRNDYAMQQYKDFALNLGQYRAGSTNITVYKTTGVAAGYVIPVMPNLDSYCAIWGGSNGNGGGTLFSPQFVMTAAHLGTMSSSAKINFLTTSGSNTTYTGITYTAAGYYTYGYDGMTIRLTKIVTEVAYTPLCTDTDLITSLSSSKTLLYRLGNGISTMVTGNGYSTSTIVPNSPLGGTMLSTSVNANFNTTGNYRITATLNQSFTNPLGIGTNSGDSGSPLYVYNSETGQFETVGILSTGTTLYGWGNTSNYEYNPTAIQTKVDSATDYITLASTGEALYWNAASTGTLVQTVDEEEISYAYTGKSSSTTLSATKGVQFDSAADSQTIYLTANINMGYGSVNFNSGNYTLAAEEDGTYTITQSAGFIVGEDATVEFQLDGQGEEWRFVTAGIVTLSGEGDNNITLNVGGGVMTFDSDGSIIHVGEVRLNRTGGTAATSITLSAGVASIVLMQDGQIAEADDFTFGNMGGVLNLNGQSLTWDVINHEDYGATISNTRLSDAAADHEQALSTFTYTGTGTFLGTFTDGGSEEDGLLKVVYQGASSSSSWVLTGVSDNMGGYVVEEGYLYLRGYLTAHAGSNGATTTISGDYTYAVLETSSVTVEDGGVFVLGHHALMTGDVTVEDGGIFVMNQTVNAAQEYIGGSQVKEDVTNFESLKGNVSLASGALMQVSSSSSVAINYGGNITGEGDFEKIGSGDLKLSGANTFSGTKTLSAGTLTFASTASLGDTTTNKWVIAEEGVLIVTGENADATLSAIDGSSSGVLALDADQLTQLDLTDYATLLIGATEGNTFNYGEEGTTETLTATNGAWRFGGGGGQINVNYQLTGEGDLIIGNDSSSGTVKLTNAANDFSGNIYIMGYNNYLIYDSLDALGSARISVSYGNSMNVHELSAATIEIISSSSDGVLALYSEEGTVSRDIDFTSDDNANIAIAYLGAADGMAIHYTGALTSNGSYRFGGTGTLYVDTELTGSDITYVDAQGMTGGTIVLTQANSDYTGTVRVGGKLDSSSDADTGSITLELQTDALSNAAAVTLYSGGTLALNGTDATIHELGANSGSSIINSGTTEQTLTIDNDSNATYSGVLGYGSAALNIVKTGAGTLTLSSNSSYQGTITVQEGAIAVTASSGLGSSSNTVVLEDDGVLELTLNGNFGTYSVNKITSSVISQAITGTGTINLTVNQTSTVYTLSLYGYTFTHTWSSTKSVVAFTQDVAFEGTVNLQGNSRLIIGSGLEGMSNLTALNSATVNVASGSQAVVTNRLSGTSSLSAITCSTNFILNGTTYSGGYGSGFGSTNISQTIYGVDYAGSSLTNKGGALRVDCGSILTGTVTLAASSTISSVWSSAKSGSPWASAYGSSSIAGGTLLGAILGEGKALTLEGNGQITLKADSPNTYGNLSITNTAGVRTAYGAAESTTSTALGTGTVTLSAASTLTFGNAEQGSTDIVYTYNNAFTISNASAKLYGEYNTTTITGTVTATTAITLGAAQEAALRLEGGLSSSSGVTLTGDGGTVGIGGDSATYTGTITAVTDSDLAILGNNALSSATVDYSDATSFTLRLEGTGEFSLATLTGAATTTDDDGNEVASTSVLSLHFDFTDGSTGSSLAVATLTDVTNGQIYIDLSATNDIAEGTYTLIENASASVSYFTLASSTLDGRLSLSNDADGNLILTVSSDNRLYWHGSESEDWNTSDSNWKLANADDSTLFEESKGVIFGSAGADHTTVTIGSETVSGSVLIRDGMEYTFTGEGAITGDASSLTVTDGATLNLQTSGNIFGEGVTVTDGTLVLGSAAAVTSSAISLGSGGVLELGASDAVGTGSTVSFNGGTLRFGADDVSVDGGTLAEGTSVFMTVDLNGHSGLGITSGAPTSASYVFTNSSATQASIALGSSDATITPSSASLDIEENVSVTLYSSGGTIATLEGEGDFTLNNTSSPMTIADMSGFTGTITKTGGGTLYVTTISETANWVFLGQAWTSSTAGMNFNSFASDSATITLIGANGGTGTGSYFSTGTLTFAQTFILENGDDGYAIRISNGSSSGVVTFSGAITGSGTFLLESLKVTQGITFSGDLSGFTGGLTISGVTASSSQVARFTLSDDGGATEYADNDKVAGTGTISINNINDSTTINMLNLEYAADHGLANTIEGNGNIGKSGEGVVTMTGDLSGHTGAITVSEGGMAIKGTGSLGSSSLTAEANTSLSVEGVSGLASDITAAEGAKVTLKGNGELSGAITAAEGSAVTLSGDQEITGSVTSSGGSVTVTDGTASISGDGSLSAASQGWDDSSTTTVSSIVYVETTGEIALAGVVHITSKEDRAELENVMLSGSEITSASGISSGYYGAITNGQLTFGEANTTAVVALTSAALLTASEDSTVDTDADTVDSTTGTTIDYDYAVIAVDLVNTTATNYTTSTVVFYDVYVDADSSISNAGDGTVYVSDSYLATSDSDIFSLDETTGVYSLTLDSLDNVELIGSLTLVLSDVTAGSVISADTGSAAEQVNIVLTGTTYQEEYLSGVSISTTSLFDYTIESVVTDTTTNTTTISLLSATAAAAVPEPATTTMSLLALAALAARRRRARV